MLDGAWHDRLGTSVHRRCSDFPLATGLLISHEVVSGDRVGTRWAGPRSDIPTMLDGQIATLTYDDTRRFPARMLSRGRRPSPFNGLPPCRSANGRCRCKGREEPDVVGELGDFRFHVAHLSVAGAQRPNRAIHGGTIHITRPTRTLDAGAPACGDECEHTESLV